MHTRFRFVRRYRYVPVRTGLEACNSILFPVYQFYSPENVKIDHIVGNNPVGLLTKKHHLSFSFVSAQSAFEVFRNIPKIISPTARGDSIRVGGFGKSAVQQNPRHSDHSCCTGMLLVPWAASRLLDGGPPTFPRNPKPPICVASPILHGDIWIPIREANMALLKRPCQTNPISFASFLPRSRSLITLCFLKVCFPLHQRRFKILMANFFGRCRFFVLDPKKVWKGHHPKMAHPGFQPFGWPACKGEEAISELEDMKPPGCALQASEKISLVDHYVDGSGRQRIKGNDKLKRSQSYPLGFPDLNWHWF